MRKDPALEALEGGWPCGHFDFRCLVSGTVREYVSALINHACCGTLLRQPGETKHPMNKTASSGYQFSHEGPSARRLCAPAASSAALWKKDAHFARISLSTKGFPGREGGALLFPSVVLTLCQEGAHDSAPTKHAGLLQPPAEEFMAAPRVFKTLDSWKSDPPLA